MSAFHQGKTMAIRFLLTLLFISLAACGGETKQRKATATEAATEPDETVEETTEPEEEKEEEEEVAEKPEGEQTQKKKEEVIDLGLKGNSSGNVKIDSGDTADIASIGAISDECDLNDPSCLKKLAKGKMDMLRRKCKSDDQECVRRVLMEEASKAQVDRDGNKIQVREKK